ncbi:hypothetical protein BT96DRAFT_991391 [Gymnopus androsaceus JB14]|uniref:DUF6534 domain-containing protein n=1 Tax=Gymnopus androsaceus JB14 TaxID=1447944 RepID=A0A6A4HZU0_9AGAR|nr:hypothetical protein BT96DRAFT_991391 [Gymnopus androsaceus JB14]
MSGLSAAEQAEINLILGGTVVGNYFSYLTMGIVLSATWTYFSKFPNDTWWFKAIVILCLSMCIGDTIATGGHRRCILTYDFAVTNYANPSALMLIKWPIVTEPVLLTMLWSHCAALLCVAHLDNVFEKELDFACSAICWEVHILATRNLLSELDVLLTSYIWFGSSIAADAIITGSMIYYLDLRFRMRPEFPSGVSPNRALHRSFRKLIVRTVECNLLSLLAQVVTVGLFARVSVTGAYSDITGMTLAKIYTFSLLVSLNCRQSKNNYGTSSGDFSPSGGGGFSLSVGGGFSSSRGGGINLTTISDRRGTATSPTTRVDIQQETAGNWPVQTKRPKFNADELSEIDTNVVVSPVTG